MAYSVEEFVGEYVQPMYSSLFAPVTFFYPAPKYVFDGVQEETVTIYDAFNLVLRRKYNCRSIEQWACAHPTVMAAVKSHKRTAIIGYTTQGSPVRVFDADNANVRGLVYLCDDILATVDDDSMLLTWWATTGEIIDRLEVSEYA